MLRVCFLTSSCHAHTQNASRLRLVDSYKSGHEKVVQRCLKYHARKNYGQPVRWSVLHIPVLNSPGVSIIVDYFGPLSTMARGGAIAVLYETHWNGNPR